MVFRLHALERMFKRKISEKDVRNIVETGKTIESYPDDQPYPSRLVFGWISNRPIHVVVADNQAQKEIIVITTYEPDTDRWEYDFERRKQ